MSSDWNHHRGAAVCFALTFSHPFFKVPVLGPFASGAAAGRAMDRLLQRYPDASIRLERIIDPTVVGLTNSELDAAAELAEALLDSALTEPFSVVEGLECFNEEPRPIQARALAERAGCAEHEVVFCKGADGEREPMWLAFRRHLQTTDRVRAESKALWRRRELEQNGLSGECISVVTLPLVVPSLGV